MTIYYLLTGRYPYRLADYGYVWDDFVQAVETGVPDVRETAPHVTLGLARVVRTATDGDLTQRYPDAASLDRALAALNAPKRVIREVSPCHPDGRCWDAEPGAQQSLQPIHVSVVPNGRRVQVEARHEGGNRITALCQEVTPGKLPRALRSAFRSLL